MLRLPAASFVLAILSCAPSKAGDSDRLPQQATRLVVQCSNSKVTVDNPDTYWDKIDFNCDENGRVRIAKAGNQ